MSPGKILIIDDDENLNRSLRKVLELEGFSADSALDGDTGLGMIMTGQYDIVILDMKIPRADGFSLYRETVKAQPRARIMIMSGMTEEFRNMFTKDEMKKVALWLTKPFDMQLMISRIKELTDEK